MFSTAEELRKQNGADRVQALNVAVASTKPHKRLKKAGKLAPGILPRKEVVVVSRAVSIVLYLVCVLLCTYGALDISQFENLSREFW